jgi:hypothetical protein
MSTPTPAAGRAALTQLLRPVAFHYASQPLLHAPPRTRDANAPTRGNHSHKSALEIYVCISAVGGSSMNHILIMQKLITIRETKLFI